MRVVLVSIPAGPSSRSKALSSPPKGPLRTCSLDTCRQRLLSFSLLLVSSLPLSWSLGIAATAIGRVFLLEPGVWRISHVVSVGCRWRLPRGRRGRRLGMFRRDLVLGRAQTLEGTGLFSRARQQQGRGRRRR